MFESCRAHFRVARAARKLEGRVVGHFGSDVSERHAVSCARDAADLLVAELQLVACLRFALDVEDAKLPVHLSAEVLPRDRLLPGIAAFAEADVRLPKAGLGREDLVVE